MADLGSVGEASVDLVIKQGKLKTGLKKAEKASGTAGKRAGDAFAKGFNSRKAAIAGTLAGLFSAAAFRGFLRSSEEAIDKLDEIAKTADSIGLTTDALQELRVAADLSGVSSQALNASMRKFTRGISEAADGVAEYAATFEGLGVEVQNADGSLRDADKVLADVADRFAEMDDATRKAALSQDLFGRSGVALVNLLNEGSGGIKAMREEARKLGIVIDEDLIRKSVIAKDKMTLLNKVIDAEMTTALANAAPLLIDFIRLIAAVTTAAGDAHQGLRVLFNFAVSDPAVRKMQITERLDELENRAVEVSDVLKNTLTTGSATAEFSLFGKPKAALTEEEFITANKVANDELVRISEERKSLFQELSSLGKTDDQGNLPASPEKVTVPGLQFDPTSTTGAADKAAEAEKAAEAFATMTEELQKSIQAQVDEQTVIDAKVQTLGEEALVRNLLLEKVRQNVQQSEIFKAAQEAGLELTSLEVQKAMELAAALGMVTEARITDNDNLEKRSKLLEEAAQKEREVATQVEAMGDQLIETAIKGGDLEAAIKDVIVQLVVMALKTAFLSGPGGSGAGGLGGIFGSVIAGALGGTATFADGGSAKRGSLAIVGEEGPELGVFGSNAQIFSNDDMKQILNAPRTEVQQATAANQTTIAFNISTPDVAGFNRSRPQMAAEARQIMDMSNRQI